MSELEVLMEILAVLKSIKWIMAAGLGGIIGLLFVKQ